MVERLAAALRAHGVEAESEAVGAASVRHGLQELSERADAGLLVVGSTTRGVAGRILGGTTATALLHGAGCAVAVAPRSYRSPGGAPLTVGVGFDGSVDAEVALADAAAFAKATGARLRVLAAADFSTWVEPVGFTAFDYSEIMRDQLRFLERTLQHAVDAVPDDVAVEPVVREGDAATVLREASDDLDLLVCGSRGYGAVRGALLGSVTRRLVQSGGCPVVVVPRAGGSEGRSLAGLVAASAPSPPHLSRAHRRASGDRSVPAVLLLCYIKIKELITTTGWRCSGRAAC